MKLTDVAYGLGENADGLFAKHSQDIDQGWLGRLREKRNTLATERCGDMLHVASVPAIFIHKWLREGFNAYQAPLKEVVAKIKAENLDAFLATDKRL